MTRIHYAHVDEVGTLRMDAPVVYEQALRALAGRPVEVTVRRKGWKRSDRQNAWYWGQILELLSEHTGYTPDELHEYCKSRFIPKKLAICDGNGIVVDERVVGGSTTRLNTVEMADYCEAIRRFAAEDVGVVIPDPDQAWAMNRKTEASR